MGSEIAGYGVIDRWEDHDHLISIAILPEHRRKGLGETLLLELEKRHASDRSLQLEVRQSNYAAIRLYSKMGYKRSGTSEGYYTDGEDAIIMEKTSTKETLASSQVQIA